MLKLLFFFKINMHGTVHRYCSYLLFIGTVHVYCSSVLFMFTVHRYCSHKKKIFFLVYLTLQTFDNMQELYFIKCLLVIHARNDASKIIF